MTLNQEVDALRRVPLFRQIEARRLKLLAFTSERLVFSKSEDVDPLDPSHPRTWIRDGTQGCHR